MTRTHLCWPVPGRAARRASRRIAARVGVPDIDSTTTVTLAHREPTSNGNQPIVSIVADPSFRASGMAGGQGGNCAAGQVCKEGIDCASQVCSSDVCQ